MTFPRYAKRMKAWATATCGRSFAMPRFVVSGDPVSKLWGTGAILWHRRGLEELLGKYVTREDFENGGVGGVDLVRGRLNFDLIRPNKKEEEEEGEELGSTATSRMKKKKKQRSSKQIRKEKKEKKKKKKKNAAQNVADFVLYSAVSKAYSASLPLFLPHARTQSEREGKAVENAKWRLPVDDAWSELLAQEDAFQSTQCRVCAATTSAM
jgi:hypothetical protein